MASVAPNVQDIKVRVTDADVEHLAALQRVRSVELVSFKSITVNKLSKLIALDIWIKQLHDDIFYSIWLWFCLQ